MYVLCQGCFAFPCSVFQRFKADTRGLTAWARTEHDLEMQQSDQRLVRI